MTFVPQAGTPLEDVVPAGDLDELLTIAVLRLAVPDALIPASLDVDGIAGLERRLDAGANVVTSIVPPTRGLAGVSQSELDIEEGYRTVEGVLPHLERLGLRAGTVDEYRAWLAEAHERARGPRVRLLVVGGKLQGTEAAYLAGKAGWDVVLVDRRPAPPAAGLAARHVRGRHHRRRAGRARAGHVVRRRAAGLRRPGDARVARRPRRGVGRAAAVRPGRLPGHPVQGGLAASSSSASACRCRRPGPPAGSPPWSSRTRASGSDGVAVVHDEAGLEEALAALRAGGHEPVVEEYVAGPSLSYEVLAAGGRARALQVTGLEFDAVYDCKRVVAPVGEAGPGGAPAPVRGRRLDGLGAGRARGHAGPLRRRLRAPRRRPRPARPHGRRGDGARRRAAPAGDRRPPAQPDADGRVLVERPQHPRGAVADHRRRRAARRPTPRLAAPACTSTSACGTAWRRSAASTSWAVPVRSGSSAASTAPTRRSPITSPALVTGVLRSSSARPLPPKRVRGRGRR